ncbi:carboxypeptidase regulatory-like domain-containing protein [Prevotella sp. 10(H)]|uniref:carboxypeptidase regulatory-like domain-containing protein n=1 Tax=Prevotella sp. 10(H) TaxID=1158294 RepID=UPI0004A6D9FB|nr:carboxypeptidase regulatory-like domain-containing protein [Prevotella sp. 10(H)]
MRNLSFILTAILCLAQASCVIDKTDDTVLISGIIKNSSGEGIQGVTVKVESTSGNIDTQSSSNGYYSFNMPSGGTAFLVFSKDGYTSQSKDARFRGGQKLEIDMTLNTLSEDAYLKVDKDYIEISNNSGKKSITVSTNVSYEVECEADWITNIKKIENIVSFSYSNNEEPAERTAVIKFKGEYEQVKAVTVKQMAGTI